MLKGSVGGIPTETRTGVLATVSTPIPIGGAIDGTSREEMVGNKRLLSSAIEEGEKGRLLWMTA